MNVVDLVIIGAVGLVALMGLKSGILKPVSGIGGIILGVVLAFEHHVAMSAFFAQYLSGEMSQRIAAFAAIVLSVAVAVRLVAWLIKKVLSGLFLGWIDHLAGALGGATLGVLFAGTIVYLLGGIDIAPAREVLDSSVLAPQISQASLVAPSTPWCTALAKSASADGCTDLKGLASHFMGMDLDSLVNEMLGGHDVGTLIEIVKRSLNGGSPEQFMHLVNAGEK